MIVVRHVILQDNVIIWSFGFMGKRQWRWVIILLHFVAKDIVVVEE